LNLYERCLTELTIELLELESKYPIGKPLNTSFMNFLRIVDVGNQSERVGIDGQHKPDCPVENFEQLALDLYPGMP
jgi:hypothetical protein